MVPKMPQMYFFTSIFWTFSNTCTWIQKHIWKASGKLLMIDTNKSCLANKMLFEWNVKICNFYIFLQGCFPVIWCVMCDMWCVMWHMTCPVTCIAVQCWGDGWVGDGGGWWWMMRSKRRRRSVTSIYAKHYYRFLWYLRIY